MSGTPHPDAGAVLVRGVLRDLALNTAVPLALYEISKRFISPSDFVALAIATTFPGFKALYDFSRRREFDPITIIVLIGIVFSAVSLALGGSPRLLLIRESFVTAAFGLACLVSLALPRPVMFYLGRYFVAGPDPARRARYDSSWRYADVRRSQRLISAVWGVAFLIELGIRTLMAFRLSPAVVLVLSPLLMAAIVVGTLIWTFRLVARVQRVVVERLDQEMGHPNLSGSAS